MEKRKWLWKRKSSERSLGETESSGSMSSPSERYSDDQEASKESPNHNSQSPEVTSKEAITNEEINGSIKTLTEKLSAALVNVSAKEDLVKQHAKVAEEAVAGWEKAETEVVILKRQLEAALKQNLALEDRMCHLDGALKECVRQLRQGREEQEEKINEAIAEKTREWESTRARLESQLLQLQAQAEAAKAQFTTSVDPDVYTKLESLEKENAYLEHELLSRLEELEIRTIERDLSAQAAETASKQHLESIKKVAKLEAECRRLQAVARKSSSANDQKSIAVSSTYVESLTDSHSDSGERLNALEADFRKVTKVAQNASEPSCSDSWALALITELDQFKNEKALRNSITGSPLEIDMMDDFLEMERLAALPETENRTHVPESLVDANELVTGEDPLKAELEAMSCKMVELEDKLKKIEAEKAELEKALIARQEAFEASQAQLNKAEMRFEELQKELTAANESKELLQFQLISMEAEARTLSAKFDSLNDEAEKERNLSAEMAVKCRELEDELSRKSQEIELHQVAISNSKPKINQEDLDVAAGKLAECQKTIASLGRQLQSLATLEDFLIDTTNLPGFPNGPFMPKSDLDPPKFPVENLAPSVNGNEKISPNSGPSLNGNDEKSPASSSASSSSSSNQVNSSKSRNGFGKLFSRNKSGLQLENQQA